MATTFKLIDVLAIVHAAYRVMNVEKDARYQGYNYTTIAKRFISVILQGYEYYSDAPVVDVTDHDRDMAKTMISHMQFKLFSVIAGKTSGFVTECIAISSQEEVTSKNFGLLTYFPSMYYKDKEVENKIQKTLSLATSHQLIPLGGKIREFKNVNIVNVFHVVYDTTFYGTNIMYIHYGVTDNGEYIMFKQPTQRANVGDVVSFRAKPKDHGVDKNTQLDYTQLYFIKDFEIVEGATTTSV